MEPIFFKVKVNDARPVWDSHAADCQDPAVYDEVECALLLPKDYDPAGAPSPVILFAHGYAGYIHEGQWRAMKWEAPLMKYYAENGFAVFGVDNTTHSLTGQADLGCPKLLESYLKAFRYIRTHYNVQEQLMIHSGSFGTFTAMNLMTRMPWLVKTAVMTGCRFGMKVVFDRPDRKYARDLAKGFGFRDRSGETFEPDRFEGFDAYAEIHEEDGKEVLRRQLPPVKAVISLADTREIDEALRAIKALQNAGNQIELRLVDGLTHGEVCELEREGLRREAVLWFERFI